MIEAVRSKRGDLREAGELLGVEAVDRTGLVVTTEGAFVRIFRVAPVNPLLMSGEEREKAAGTFQRLISQLHADEAPAGAVVLPAAGSALCPNPAIEAPPSANACALTSGLAAASVRIASRSCGVHSPSAW